MKKSLLFLAVCLTSALLFSVNVCAGNEKTARKAAKENVKDAPGELPVHAWKGRKVAFFGDSITDPSGSAEGHYWQLLQKWLGITPYVYAVSGMEWNDIIRQGTLLKEEHGDDVDAILILMGTNDYNLGVPTGSWYTESLARVEAAVGEPKALKDRIQRHLVMSDSTFRGRINRSMAFLKKTFPTKQIVLLTPLHRAGFYYTDNNWQPSEDYRNRCGEYLDAYVQAVREAAQVWAVPVIDLGALCGIYPMEENQGVYCRNEKTDRLHPNEAGYKRIALTLYYQLQALPCSFE